jgi:hypothetical protein
MSRLPILALALALPLAACGERSPTGAAAASTAESVSAAAIACVTFGPPPPLWTWWGVPAGHAPGQVVHVENAVLVSVEKFLIGASTTFDRARIEPPPVAGFGVGQTVRTQYINLGFGFQQLTWIPNHVRFQFHDTSLSSIENLIVNGAPYVGTIQGAPAVLGGVAVTVAGNWVDLAGPVASLRVGGQQLWIDELCAAP